MSSDINAIWNELGKDLAGRIEQQLLDKLEERLERFVRVDIKIVFSEREAAEKLGVSRGTLQNWRRANLIDHYLYPPSGNKLESKSRSRVGYSLTHLQDFLLRFEVRQPYNARKVR